MMNDSFSPSLSLPNVLLLFDVSALVVGKTREWQEFSRVGRCFVTPKVLEEIKSLASHAAEPEQEQIAREFCRFYPKSGWRSSILSASHPAIQPASGAAASKRARLAFNMAEAAYGLAQHQPKELVVLISNDQSLLQRVKLLEIPNLCGIPVSALLLWSRTQRRPMVVNQQFRQMMSGSSSPTTTTMRVSQPVIASRPVARSYTTSRTPTATKSPRSTTPQTTSAVAVRPSTKSRPAKVRTELPGTDTLKQFISQSISFVLATIALVTIITVAWRTFHPTSFNRFWQQNNLPALPGQPAPTKRQ